MTMSTLYVMLKMMMVSRRGIPIAQPIEQFEPNGLQIEMNEQLAITSRLPVVSLGRQIRHRVRQTVEALTA